MANKELTLVSSRNYEWGVYLGQVYNIGTMLCKLQLFFYGTKIEYSIT